MSEPQPHPDLASIPCAECHKPGRLRISYEDEMVVRPWGTYSLAGVQEKFSAHVVSWPWMVCDYCGARCRGKRDDS